MAAQGHQQSIRWPATVSSAVKRARSVPPPLLALPAR